MAVEKLADAEDGWGLALDSIASGVGFPSTPARWARRWPRSTRAGRGVPRRRADRSDVAAVMAERLDRATATATALGPTRPACRPVRRVDARQLRTQRVHGDFHLGQTLHTPAGWKIIDFEGEPAKSLAERVVPDSVCRDLAGMLRSFDYAAASVPARTATGGRRTVGSLPGGIRLAGSGSAAPSPAEENAVLDAYEADKAVYEVVYEARNRPDWVRIPLAAVAVLASANQVKE